MDEGLRLSWRALASAFMVGPRSCSAALADLERAQELAPHYAPAEGDRCLVLEPARGAPFQRYAGPGSRARAAACRHGSRPCAARLIERSLAMDPWPPWAWARRAWSSAYAGDDDGALREMQITLRLMPFEPLRHLMFIDIGCVHFNAGRYGRAARWIQDGMAAGPESFWAERVLVAAAAHGGAGSEARRYAHKLLRKDASLTVAIARRSWPFRPAFMHRLCDGLAMAGVPWA